VQQAKPFTSADVAFSAMEVWKPLQNFCIPVFFVSNFFSFSFSVPVSMSSSFIGFCHLRAENALYDYPIKRPLSEVVSSDSGPTISFFTLQK